MISNQKVVPGRIIRSLLLLAAITCFSQFAAADSEMPKSVAALLPASAELRTHDWGVVESEFGSSFGGSMDALFPGKYPSCSDSIYKSQLSVGLKGDTAWEEPPMLDMAIQMYEEEVDSTRESMAESLATSVRNHRNVKSIGDLKEEQLPNGHVFYIEFVEDCDRHPGGTKTLLKGFARRGATLLDFRLALSATGAEARAMAVEILGKFEQLDIAGLRQ